jgi:formylglycine-generating enzyme required for sulfatase activity
MIVEKASKCRRAANVGSREIEFDFIDQCLQRSDVFISRGTDQFFRLVAANLQPLIAMKQQLGRPKLPSSWMTMVLIPPGEFMMGMSEDERAKGLKEATSQRQIDTMKNYGPQHPVRLSEPYWLSRHEVTLGEFRRFVEATGYKTEAERDGNSRLLQLLTVADIPQGTPVLDRPNRPRRARSGKPGSATVCPSIPWLVIPCWMRVAAAHLTNGSSSIPSRFVFTRMRTR